MFEPINLEDLLDAEPEPQRYLVDPLIPEASLALISGQAKRNKTFVCLALGISVAYGVPFADTFAVPRPRRVLIILNEDGTVAVGDRMEKLLRGVGLQKEDLPPGQLQVLCRRGFHLDDMNDITWLHEYIEEHDIALVILDPFAEMFTGEENSEREVKRALKPLKELRNSTKCSVLLAHHQGKPRENSGGRRANAVRGSSYFIGWYDVGLHINAGAEGAPLKIKPEFRNREGMDEFILTLFGDKDSRVLRFVYEPIDKDKAANEALRRVEDFVSANPGAKTREVLKKPGGREATNRAALGQLIESGKLTTEKEGQAVLHYVAKAGDATQ